MNENIEIKKIIGFNKVEEQFQKSISIRNNQTWMLVGRKGIGKRSLSMRFAGYIINKFDINWETSELTNEVFNKETDNLYYITALDEKNSGKISKEQIDNLSSKFKFLASPTCKLSLTSGWQLSIAYFEISIPCISNPGYCLLKS